jgi:hypothetical protein
MKKMRREWEPEEVLTEEKYGTLPLAPRLEGTDLAGEQLHMTNGKHPIIYTLDILDHSTATTSHASTPPPNYPL